MTTEKKRQANRRNAKKSTGPRTPAGKARAARNATKHGLLARRVVLSDEDPAEFEAQRLSLIQELWPETPLERQIVERLAGIQWRLARVPVIEAALLERRRYDVLGRDEGLGAVWTRDGAPDGGALMRLARYEAALERNAARLLAELRRLRADRHRAERKEAPSDTPAAGSGDDWWRRAAAAWPGAPQARQTASAPQARQTASAPEAMRRNEANGSERPLPTPHPAGAPLPYGGGADT